MAQVEEVVLVLPCVFPHKSYEGADFAQRSVMLRAAVEGYPRLLAATSQGGLFLEIAEECRAACGRDRELAFVCGRDAAERVINWRYRDLDDTIRMMNAFYLLVAPRHGAHEPPAHLRHFVRPLSLAADLSAVSASEVRRSIRAGEAWEHLVPEAILSLVRQVYRPAA